MPESAPYHAKRYLEVCKGNSIGSFDLAYAYEAMARAYAVAGKKKKLIGTLSWRKKLETKSKKRKIETYFTATLRQFPVTKRNDSNTMVVIGISVPLACKMESSN
jgi:hypothetical protein